MTIKNKDNILLKSGNHKGKKGKVIKIIKTRALVELLTKEVNRLIEMDFSNLLVIYRPILNKENFLNAKKFKILNNVLRKMIKMNKELNYLFSREEFKNFLKIRSLENIKNKQ
ncbi:hypothetical protein ONB76_00590 [Candidatus Karelsulcia muelleri]|uniref:KOW domain-containing protein n=1 Tax=Candidatus Karelsulcia muelleri TaxID=336810 RepID=A0A346E101_9FLAO|nr:KOW motif-containing protein [Candidatus Karelsulcia muelleri]AXN02656.1 hypothetical protein C9I73_119 [Candidatus Karelsulcia muelleri]WDI79587.1 hypothetical protein ONB75_00300 [Candidatus Karelsulcia muelleri]WDR78909.1 hypothetical protein ONB76_00590 [Candidatus Karelsulcia muelleri]